MDARELCARYRIEVEQLFGPKKFYHTLRQEGLAQQLIDMGYTVDSFIEDAKKLLVWMHRKGRPPPFSLQYFVIRKQKQNKPIDVEGLVKKIVANSKM
jgi:hypothetical protein